METNLWFLFIKILSRHQLRLIIARGYGSKLTALQLSTKNNRRPPHLSLSKKQPLEILMTRCWDKDPSKRPSMDEVVTIMTHLMNFFPGAEEPIIYPGDEDEDEEEAEYAEMGESDSCIHSNSPGTMSDTLHPTSPGGGFNRGR